ncbi:MAG: NAD(P)-binding domain-containing protein [Aquisalinus sp.]|nr:NAD(P)-binding domain-containing protein [Aquisalinus sp.]
MKIGILGAGSVGNALASLAQAAGHQVVLSQRNPSDKTASFEYAAQASDIVIIAIPYAATASVLPTLSQELSGKTVIDATNPLNDDWSPKILDPETSGAELIATLLPASHVVKAFNTIFADIMTPDGLKRLGVPVTVFVAGDHLAACQQVSALANEMGFAPIETGPLATARYLEAMAHLNIAIAVGQGKGTDAAFIYHQGTE